MIKLLFWNIGKLTDNFHLEGICRSEGIDILLTAEDDGERKIGDSLSALGFSALFNPTDRGLRFYNRTNKTISHVHDDAYLSAKCIEDTVIGKLLVILVHYPSKMHMSDSDQVAFLSEQAKLVDKIERRANTENTIVVGDFNVSPHEDAMLQATSFNAVSCRTVAEKGTRKIKGGEYKFFYNPMWRFYTSFDGNGRGTFYSHPKGYRSIYWHIFDQVIIRPSLLDYIWDVDIIDIAEKRG